MKANNQNSSTGPQKRHRQMKEMAEPVQFIIYMDPERLESLGCRMNATGTTPTHAFGDNRCEILSAVDWPSLHDCSCDLSRQWLVAKLINQVCEILFIVVVHN